MARGNIFKQVLMPKVSTNRFNLSHEVKMSFRMGQLVPSCIMEILPGDKVSISVENMLRFAPLLAPVMHKVNVVTHFYFVPNRIMWPEWEKWITDQLDVEPPYWIPNAASMTPGCLADYLGYPIAYTPGLKMSAFPLQAYLMVWDQYYKDQNLVGVPGAEMPPLTFGNNTTLYLQGEGGCFKRAWEHDYFTACLPFAQKGDAVELPIAVGEVPVTLVEPTTATAMEVKKALDHTSFGATQPLQTGTSNAAHLAVAGQAAHIDPKGNLIVDVQSEATDINTLRRAFRLQEWLERNARGGTRYIEHILSHFGIRSSDARLQRPEYLGGAYQRMAISEVLSTAETTDAPIGQMAGHGVSVGSGNTFSYRAEEHGWILGLINVQPNTAYSQGLHRSYSRFDRLDYGWPTFANIGEQDVKVKELYANPATAAELEETFGYIPRYSEYKYMNSRVAGEMRTSLNFWHMAREFSSKPLLNESFIEADPTDRIFAVQDPNVHHVYAQIFNNISAVRKLPMFGIPTI